MFDNAQTIHENLEHFASLMHEMANELEYKVGEARLHGNDQPAERPPAEAD